MMLPASGKQCMALAPFSPTILCVDDEASGLYFRTLILESQGYKVIAGTSAQEGLNLFKANQVDLVITDHLMGRATGTIMAAEMKRLKPGVPIISLRHDRHSRGHGKCGRLPT